MQRLLLPLLAALCLFALPARAQVDPHAWMIPTGWTAVALGGAAEIAGLVVILQGTHQLVGTTGAGASPLAAQLSVAQRTLAWGEGLTAVGGTVLAGGFALLLSHALLPKPTHGLSLAPAPGGAALALSF